MRLLFFILVFLFVVPSFAQQTLSGEEKPLKNGRYRHRTADFRSTGWVRHHKPDGKWVYRNKRKTEKGERWVITRITHFRNGQLHGRRTEFALNGDTLADGNYRNGKMVGEWRYYHCENSCDSAGHLANVLHYDNEGKPIGTHCEYYRHGVISVKKVYVAPDSFYEYTYNWHGDVVSRCWYTSFGPEGIFYGYFQSDEARAQGDTAYTATGEYHKGAAHGFERNYERGHLVREVYYEHGLLHGPFRLFKNDTLQTEWNYVHGKRDGLHREFERGVLSYEETYVNNERKGNRYIYASNGALQESGWYEGDIPDGEHLIYDTITRQKIDAKEYNIGLLKWHRKWTTTGQLIYEKKLSADVGGYYNITEWHADGKMKMHGAELNGHYEGTYEEWHWNGKRSVLMSYTDGSIEGEVRVWNAKGILVYRSTACRGSAGDDETVYDDNGRRLLFESDAYKAQVEKYAPQSLASFVENGYRFADVVIRQDVVRDKYLEPPLHRYLYSDTREEPQGAQSDPCANDHRPQFPGGESARQKFLVTNIRYPEMEREQHKEGVVYIQFTVNTDSTISDVKALREVPGSPGLTKETMRVINKMPKWAPATRNGKPVAAKCVFAVRFELK